MKTKQNNKTAKTAVIYARARGDSLDEENQAIQAQLRECREWAEKNGYSVAKAYIDQGKGAFHNVEQREGLKELVADALSKPQSFDAVFYYSPDRLFRNVLELETFRLRLKREQVKLICVTGGWLQLYERMSQGATRRALPESQSRR